MFCPVHSGMSLVPVTEREIVLCARCEGKRYADLLEDDICSACLREAANLTQVAESLPDDTMPISVKMYHDYMMAHFERELKSKARKTRLIIAPFSVAVMHTLREYMLVRNPALYFPLPKQTKGMRGGKTVVWKMVVEDHTHFSSAMVDDRRDRLCQGLTGELRESDAAYVCWIPPLTFELTIVRARGRMIGTCVVASGCARMTGEGFSFPPRTAEKFHSGVMKFMSLAAFGIQKERSDENRRRAAEEPDAGRLSMLPRALLHMAIKYA